MARLLARWGKAEVAQGLVEYALILALIAIVCVGALTVLGYSIGGYPSPVD